MMLLSRPMLPHNSASVTMRCDLVALQMVYLAVQVERAKKCLDFAATCYVLHLAIVSMVGGLPRTPTWRVPLQPLACL